MNQSVLKEAIVVGIATVIIGQFVGFTLSKVMKTVRNKRYIMIWSLFFTGILIHLLCEYFGINKWYCKNGSACNLK